MERSDRSSERATRLGLRHQGGPCVGGFAGSNLMNAGGASDIETAQLTEAQCDRARCIAQRWLLAWGLVDDAPEDCIFE